MSSRRPWSVRSRAARGCALEHSLNRADRGRNRRRALSRRREGSRLDASRRAETLLERRARGGGGLGQRRTPLSKQRGGNEHDHNDGSRDRRGNRRREARTGAGIETAYRSGRRAPPPRNGPTTLTSAASCGSLECRYAGVVVFVTRTNVRLAQARPTRRRLRARPSHRASSRRACGRCFADASSQCWVRARARVPRLTPTRLPSEDRGRAVPHR